MRLIDADELMKALGITDMDCEKCEWQSGYGTYCSRGGDFEDACFAIENAPTIEPERKKGRWDVLWHSCFKTDLPVCSVCNQYAIYKTAYCPNCGADMRGE